MRQPYLRTVLIRVSGIIIIVAIALYALYQSRIFIQGPEIILDHPQDGSTITERLVVVRGRVHNISRLHLNGREILTNEAGEFEEPMILFPGNNIISIDGEDNFNRRIDKELHIVHIEDTPLSSLTENTYVQEETTEESGQENEKINNENQEDE